MFKSAYLITLILQNVSGCIFDNSDFTGNDIGSVPSVPSLYDCQVLCQNTASKSYIQVALHRMAVNPTGQPPRVEAHVERVIDPSWSGIEIKKFPKAYCEILSQEGRS